MSKTILLPRGIPIVLEKLFYKTGINEEGKATFSNGTIFSNSNEPIGSENDTAEQSAEHFLNVSYNPLSPKTKRVKIITEEEFLEKRLIEDDLLNIYLPISKEIDSNTINPYPFNSSPVLFRKGNEIRMSGFFKEGKVFISGFAVFADGGELIKVFKTTELDSNEGEFICLSLDGKIKYIPNKLNEFHFSDLTLESTTSSEIKIQGASFILRDQATDEERELLCNFVFPIGYILDGNFVCFGRGNVKITIQENEISYYAEQITDPGGKTSLYDTIHYFSIFPVFS